MQLHPFLNTDPTEAARGTLGELGGFPCKGGPDHAEFIDQGRRDLQVPARGWGEQGERQAIDLQEVLVEELGGETWLRFRFIAPQIAKGPEAIAYDLAAPDMEHLCAVVALPYMTEHALAGQVIVVSLADRPVEFGAADPEATQYFEAFRAQDDACIWEGL